MNYRGANTGGCPRTSNYIQHPTRQPTSPRVAVSSCSPRLLLLDKRDQVKITLLSRITRGRDVIDHGVTTKGEASVWLNGSTIQQD